MPTENNNYFRDPTKVFDISGYKVKYDNTLLRNLLDCNSKKTIDSYKLGFFGHFMKSMRQILSNTYSKFSILKIKLKRNTITHKRFNGLLFTSAIERELLYPQSFNDVVNEFKVICSGDRRQVL